MTNSKLDMTNPAHVLGSFVPTGSNDYDPKRIAASIQTIAAAGRKADARMHATAVALLHRMQDHKDCSLVYTLINAMPKGARTKALIAWFQAFSNAVFFKGKDGVYTPCKMHSPVTKMFKVLDEKTLADAFDKPFYSVEETATNPKAFDDKAFLGAVQSLIKRATDEAAVLGADAKVALADLQAMAKNLAPAS